VLEGLKSQPALGEEFSVKAFETITVSPKVFFEQVAAALEFSPLTEQDIVEVRLVRYCGMVM
jgi:hypothetical protein